MGEKTFVAGKAFLGKMSKKLGRPVYCYYCFKPILEGDHVTRKGYNRFKEYAHSSCYEANGYVKLKKEVLVSA